MTLDDNSWRSSSPSKVCLSTFRSWHKGRRKSRIRMLHRCFHSQQMCTCPTWWTTTFVTLHGLSACTTSPIETSTRSLTLWEWSNLWHPFWKRTIFHLRDCNPGKRILSKRQIAVKVGMLCHRRTWWYREACICVRYQSISTLRITLGPAMMLKTRLCL